MNHDPLDLNGQDQATAARDTVRRNLVETEKDDWKWLMSSPRGRRIMWRLLGWTGMYRSSFTGNSETFFREGERNVGLRVNAALLQADPQAYSSMMLEHANHE